MLIEHEVASVSAFLYMHILLKKSALFNVDLFFMNKYVYIHIILLNSHYFFIFDMKERKWNTDGFFCIIFFMLSYLDAQCALEFSSVVFFAF